MRTLARHPATPANGERPGEVEARIGDVRDAATCASALEGVDTVVSAITGFAGRDALGSRTIDRDANVQLIEAARRAGVRHVILLSVHQAGPDHPIQLFRDKWAAEEALRGSGLDWTIVRPTAYLETWLGIVGGPLVQDRVDADLRQRPEPDQLRVGERCRPGRRAGHRSTLAFAAPAIEVPGPEDLTLDQLADVVESVLGRTGRRQHLSPTMMRIASLVTRVVNPVLSAQIATAMVMDTRDMTVDGQALRARFGSIPMTTAADVAQRMFASTLNAEATAT